VQLARRDITGQHDGPHVLITGGVHGDEFEPMAAVRRLMGDLAGQDLRGRVTLVPVVNEPAFRLGQRTSEDGLDLARTCPGRPAGSITERIAHALTHLIRSADYYIDLHTGGTRLQVYPLAGYTLHPRPEILDRQRKMARLFGLPIIWGTDPSPDGRSLSVARDAGIPAIYAEYLGGGGFTEQGVAAYLCGCRNVLIDLGMLDGQVALPSQEPLVVEDARLNSGVMQIHHPAPWEGFFEPAVTLGQRVERGDLLGTVTDILGQRREPIPAAHAGFVLVLHSFARVSAEEGVAVVLETDESPPPW
jgi:predicted deacylase